MKRRSMEIIHIHSAFIKLDQLLKFAGIVESGAMAKQIILLENILVNNEICTQRGKKIYPKDIVTIKNYGQITVQKEE
ncbi:MAG: RNA-binding S4 domain-containing protein [Eubacteriales bacterium]